MLTTYRAMTLVIIASKTFSRHNWMVGSFTIQSEKTGNIFTNGIIFSAFDTFGIIIGGKIGSKFGGRIPMMFIAAIVSFLICLRLLVPQLDWIWVYVITLLVSIMANLHVCCLIELLPPHITYIVCETCCSISAFICQITPFICRFAKPIPEYTRLSTCLGFLFVYTWVNVRKR